jgi:hypothetical protein
MTLPSVYADFQNIDDANRLRLTCAGTLQDLAQHGIQLYEGSVLTFYSDDADDLQSVFLRCHANLSRTSLV